MGSDSSRGYGVISSGSFLSLDVLLLEVEMGRLVEQPVLANQCFGGRDGGFGCERVE